MIILVNDDNYLSGKSGRTKYPYCVPQHRYAADQTELLWSAFLPGALPPACCNDNDR